MKGSCSLARHDGCFSDHRAVNVSDSNRLERRKACGMPPDTEETLGKCRTHSRWTFSANSECGVCRKPVAVLVLDQTPSPKIRTEAPMPAHTCLFQPPRRSETGKEKGHGGKGRRGSGDTQPYVQSRGTQVKVLSPVTRLDMRAPRGSLTRLHEGQTCGN